jgi:hypothetical protein
MIYASFYLTVKLLIPGYISKVERILYQYFQI